MNATSPEAALFSSHSQKTILFNYSTTYYRHYNGFMRGRFEICVLGYYGIVFVDLLLTFSKRFKHFVVVVDSDLHVIFGPDQK